jgi:hypothetical protein
MKKMLLDVATQRRTAELFLTNILMSRIASVFDLVQKKSHQLIWWE